MLWSEIKRWAKDQGFEIVKEKDNSINGASYYWANINDTSISGVSLSVSKLAKDIFNIITNDEHKEHQQQYQENKTYKQFSVNDYN